jgi:hypothetical protein
LELPNYLVRLSYILEKIGIFKSFGLQSCLVLAAKSFKEIAYLVENFLFLISLLIEAELRNPPHKFSGICQFIWETRNSLLATKILFCY